MRSQLFSYTALVLWYRGLKNGTLKSTVSPRMSLSSLTWVPIRPIAFAFLLFGFVDTRLLPIAGPGARPPNSDGWLGLKCPISVILRVHTRIQNFPPYILYVVPTYNVAHQKWRAKSRATPSKKAKGARYGKSLVDTRQDKKKGVSLSTRVQWHLETVK